MLAVEEQQVKASKIGTMNLMCIVLGRILSPQEAADEMPPRLACLWIIRMAEIRQRSEPSRLRATQPGARCHQVSTRNNVRVIVPESG